MSEGLDATAILRLKVISDIDAAITSLGRYNEAVGHTDKVGSKAEKSLTGTKGAIEGTGSAAASASKKVEKYAEGFEALVKELNAFKKAEKEAAQSSVVGGSLDGSNRGALEGMSTKALKEYIAIDDARGQNAVAVARQIVSAREKEITKAEELVAAQARAKSDAIGSRGYSNTSVEVDQGIADQKKSGQDFAAGVRARMQAQQDGITADHSAALAINKTMDAQKKAAAATGVSTTANKEHTASLISARYALYDVATTYGVISAALLGVSALTIKAGADFESAFSGVERTTLDAAGNSVANIDSIKESLIDLSTQIPVSFEEITRIATLGAQLGLAADSLDEFSETVAKFAAVTGVSVDAAAMAFGSLGELTGNPDEKISNLASSISLVGVNSVATEAQILSVAQQIASYTTLAGYSTEETVGLAGALASLKVPPEQARSAIQGLFTTINKATAEGGKDLAKFANLMGLSSEATADLFRADPEKFVSRLAESLSKLDSQQLTLMLADLGLAEKRTATVLTKMAGSTALLASTQADAAQGFSENIALDQQYAKVAEDLNAQLQMLGQAFVALAASGSGDLIPALAGAVGGLKDMLNGIRDLTASGFGQQVARWAIVLTTIVGAIFAYKSAMALATASTYALRTAQTALAAQGTVGGIRGLITAMLGLRSASAGAAATTASVGTAGKAAAGGMLAAERGAITLRGALLGLGRATLIIGALQLITELVFNFGGSMKTLGGIVVDQVGVFAAGFRAIANIIGTFGQSLGPFGAGLRSVANMLGQAAAHGERAAGGFAKWGDSMAKANEATGDYIPAVNKANKETKDWTPSLDDLGGSAAGAAKEVRTLVDYASDLSGVFARAFEIRFGGGQGLDAIASGWSAIRQATADVNEEIGQYRADMQSLTADKKITEYWLRVAENYGDELQAGKLRGKLGDINQKLSKTSKDLAKATDKGSMTLEGNSDAAIANRAGILGLVTSYEDYITKLAASGMSQADLAVKAAQLKQEFIRQATQLGYSKEAINKYALAFDDVGKAIAAIPRNITVKFNGDPALQALAEFKAKAQAKLDAGGGLNLNIKPNFDGSAAAKEGRLQLLRGTMGMANLQMAAAIKSGSDNKYMTAKATSDRIAKIIASGNYASGGYTGDGGKYEPAGIVHKGEYVFSKAATSSLGVNNLARLHSVGKSGQGMSQGGFAGQGGMGGGIQVVELSAFDRSLLAQAGNMSLSLDGRVIARSTSTHNVNSSNRGSN